MVFFLLKIKKILYSNIPKAAKLSKTVSDRHIKKGISYTSAAQTKPP